VTVTKQDAPFQIIRHRGIQNRGQLADRTWVYGQDKFFIQEWGRFVPVAPYDDHFIYEVTNVKDKGSSFRCSCGSVAVISGYSAYLNDASQQGLLILCHVHASTGVHLGGSKWI
jgi:hypothetical protein